MRRVRAILVFGALLAVMSLPNVALASVGPYSLPFFTPTGVNQDYGCTSYDKEPVWSGTNADGTVFSCSGSQKYFHKGIDFDTVGRGIAAARAGDVVDIETGGTHACGNTSAVGNYVILRHDSTHFTLYYHLASGSITVAVGNHVSAGQNIGTSGDTGNACGKHLHYVLMTCNCGSPTPQHTYQPEGKWTTTTGRVPWRDSVLSHSTPPGDLCYGDTVNFWVKYTNVGGQPWKTTNDANGHSRVIIHTTDSDGSAFVTTPLVATDWETASVPGVADESTVVLDGTGTFSFGLHGGGVQGNTYDIWLNLNAEDLRNFLYPPANNFHFSVFVVPHQACI